MYLLVYSSSCLLCITYVWVYMVRNMMRYHRSMGLFTSTLAAGFMDTNNLVILELCEAFESLANLRWGKCPSILGHYLWDGRCKDARTVGAGKLLALWTRKGAASQLVLSSFGPKSSRTCFKSRIWTPKPKSWHTITSMELETATFWLGRHLHMSHSRRYPMTVGR